MEPTGMEGQALAAWEDHARSWDTTMGDEGNDYFSVLELPALERMISEQQRNRAFDLATGNGLVARWLAQEGFSVVATDGARAMLEHAKARTATWYENGRLDKERTISFELLDVTNKDQWAQFIGRSNLLKDGFDVVVMNMGIMDIPDLEPLAVSLKSLLKQDGCFVATVLHPLFFTSGARRQITVHEDPVTGQRVIDRSILLSQYQNVAPARQLLFSNDSEHKPPLSFHRSFQDLFAPFFRAGLILDALEEVNFDDTFREPSREYAARNFTEFPKILAFRLRRGYT
ncbi:S-adenosyl-L-methionine-dependent methyltransferase [Aspergillus caelatus]|uniref:S-adenosyl-L-methionine-dependent methyltransferase n=1 Tax=Aspergillus caelatus TaxID=61420 RepID=A0A5N6ZXX6_9EURO|nr:S-adenosyl-L-methionine-dependent methyltransferase [Aspergillus caelatus]KAE8361140.1 S-adenosyl-L-methionine-dependent methyltransferase [Aspergillus caelatus]